LKTRQVASVIPRRSVTLDMVLDRGSSFRVGRSVPSTFLSLARPVMSLSNSPDPAVREAVVRQDLDHVLHPIVQQEVLEA
jgi:hypothetical protein